MSQPAEIQGFIRAHGPAWEVEFCLPRFANSPEHPARLAGTFDPSFGYPSSTVAERDARSALHIMQMVCSGLAGSAAVNISDPDLFRKREGHPRTGFLFGSRSNDALSWLLYHASESKLVDFEFGDVWTIMGPDGRRFSIPDPSRLGREEYLSITDYGVVARLSMRDRISSSFLVAGLGGRATEGCGLFLSRHWAQMQERYGDRDFAVIVAFPPPVAPERYQVTAEYLGQEQHPRGPAIYRDLA
jgi:hypothetical protein